jgi:hypothetical protein
MEHLCVKFSPAYAAETLRDSTEAVKGYREAPQADLVEGQAPGNTM